MLHLALRKAVFDSFNRCGRPLILFFEQTDGQSSLAIAKAGDDLRQDQLVLKTLNVLRKLWCASYRHKLRDRYV